MIEVQHNAPGNLGNEWSANARPDAESDWVSVESENLEDCINSAYAVVAEG